MKISLMIQCSWCMWWCGVGLCKTRQLCRSKNSLDWGQISICKLRWGELYTTIEWIEIIMWCVNPHITNKMSLCINSKLGHVNDWILLISELIQSIWVDMRDMLNQISWANNRHYSHKSWQHCPTRSKGTIWRKKPKRTLEVLDLINSHTSKQELLIKLTINSIPSRCWPKTKCMILMPQEIN
jgi:hypothetical protein